MKLILGDCLEVMKTFPDSCVDSLVTDPPGFILNDSGKGFMGKEWDSITNLWRYLWMNQWFVNIAEKFLLSILLEKNTEEEFIVPKNVSIKENKKQFQENGENAPFVIKTLKLQQQIQKDFAPLIVLTKQEVLDWYKELFPSLINNSQFLNGVKENVQFVIPITLLKLGNKSSVAKNVQESTKVKQSEGKTIRLTLMDALRIKDAFEDGTGTKLEKQYIKGIIGNVQSVENIVIEKKYNATILSNIEIMEIMKAITLLLCVTSATLLQTTIQKFMIQNFFKLIFLEVYRVMKPGAWGVVWALPRTSHWTATAIENAGFEIRDIINHVFGTGFPKSLNISKAIDKEKGLKQEVVGKYKLPNGQEWNLTQAEDNSVEHSSGTFTASGTRTLDITAPTSPEAQLWNGWGTALKPACEHWILIRKPISEKTVAQNVIKWNVGGINIDDCRVPVDPEIDDMLRKVERVERVAETWKDGSGFKNENNQFTGVPANGRFPANLVHDGSEDVLEIFPITQSGKDCKRTKPHETTSMAGTLNMMDREEISYGDKGSASRFFYCTKASKKDKGEGNKHPTVKNTELMRYLCRLITPPNGIILDCFLGSGSTGVAAIKEGFRFVGIEKEKEHFDFAQQRLTNTKYA